MSFFYTTFIDLNKRDTMEEVIKIRGGMKLTVVVHFSVRKNNCLELFPPA